MLHTFVTESQQVVAIELRVEGLASNELLESTPGHPFWVRDLGWVLSEDLLPGDELLSASGAWLEVGSVTAESVPQRVFNFEVDGAHSYFVGDFGVWAHNRSLGNVDLGLPRDAVTGLRGTLVDSGSTRTIFVGFIRNTAGVSPLAMLRTIFQNARSQGRSIVNIQMSGSSNARVISFLEARAVSMRTLRDGILEFTFEVP